MSDHPEQRNGAVNPSVKYEPTDLSLRGVLTFSFSLAAVLAVVAGALWFMIPAVLGPTPPQAAQPAWPGEPGPPSDVSRLSRRPELEGVERIAAKNEDKASPVEIQQQIRNEDHTLDTYGAGPEPGTYRIPIKEAMGRMIHDQGGKP